jgi:hypothetical protein
MTRNPNTRRRIWIAASAVGLLLALGTAEAAEWQYQWFCIEKNCGWYSSAWQSLDEANRGGKNHELLSKGHRWSLRYKRIS